MDIGKPERVWEIESAPDQPVQLLEVPVDRPERPEQAPERKAEQEAPSASR